MNDKVSVSVSTHILVLWFHLITKVSVSVFTHILVVSLEYKGFSFSFHTYFSIVVSLDHKGFSFSFYTYFGIVVVSLDYSSFV